MSDTRQALILSTIAAQEEIAMAFLRLANSDWLAVDLTLTQLKGLIALTANGPIPIYQLAIILHLGRPATSTLIEQLVQMDLVTRTEDVADRRRTLVTLTEQGKDYLIRLRQGRNDNMYKLLQRLPDTDLAALAQGIQALAALAATDS